MLADDDGVYVIVDDNGDNSSCAGGGDNNDKDIPATAPTSRDDIDDGDSSNLTPALSALINIFHFVSKVASYT